MKNLWHPNSLRGLYESLNNLRARDLNAELKQEAKARGIGFFGTSKYIRQRKEEERLIMNKMQTVLKCFICPHCLKSIKTDELEVSCPFCDKSHTKANLNEIRNAFVAPEKQTNFTNALVDRLSQWGHGFLISQVLFDKCSCGSMIRHIKCIHCENDIDLFAHYDHEALERRRYE